MSDPLAFSPQVAHIEPEQNGELEKLQPATYLERWNTIFVAAGLFWMLCVTTVLLWYYVQHLPPTPSTAGLSAAQVKDALDTQKVVYDQYRQSLTDVFDLLVTRTVLPILALLLGYLFGKTPSRSSS